MKRKTAEMPSTSDAVNFLAPAGPHAENIFRSLRRIARAIDVHSRDLTSRFNLTVPQVVCLRQLLYGGPCTPSSLARMVFLSQATVTGIVDRLESRGLVIRERKEADRRRVTVSLTTQGRAVTESLPHPLQDKFAGRLGSLSESEQADIDRILDRVCEMMEAHGLETAPLGTADPLPIEQH